VVIIKKKSCIKKITFLILSIAVLIYGMLWPTWPSKARLCRDIESFIPKAECVNIKYRIEIIKRAFPEGTTTQKDVENALGEYLQEKYQTPYGYYEVYYLSIRPIDYIFRDFVDYEFMFDNNGILVAFGYQD